MMRRNVAFLGTAVIVVSAVVNVAHTASHARQHLISLPGWQLAYLSTVVTCLCLDHLRKAPPGFVIRRMRINGRLGLVGYFEDGSLHSVTTIDVAGTKSGPSASSSTRRSSVACRRWIGLK